MAIACAQSWGVNAGTSTATVTISGVQVGELLVAIGLGFGTASFTFNSPAFTDNGTGSSWTNRADSGYVTRSRVIVGETIVGSVAPTTVTVTGNAALQACGIMVFRVTGAGAASDHDASVGNSAVSATPSTGALTTTNANDLILVGLTHDGSTTTLTQPATFTLGPKDTAVTNIPYVGGFQVVAATQSAATYQFTLGASRNAVMVSAGYKAAAAATTKAPPFQSRTARNLLLRR